MMNVMHTKTKTLKSAFSIDSLMQPDRERETISSRCSPGRRRSPPRLVRDRSPIRQTPPSPRICSSEASSPSASPANGDVSPPAGFPMLPLMGGAGSSFHAVNPTALNVFQATNVRYQDIIPSRIPSLHGPDGIPQRLQSMLFHPATFPGLPGHPPHQPMAMPPTTNGYNTMLQRDPFYFYNPLLLCHNRGLFNQRLGKQMVDQDQSHFIDQRKALYFNTVFKHHNFTINNVTIFFS